MHVPVGALALVAVALLLSADAHAQTVRIQLTSLNTVQVPHNIAPTNKLNKGDFITFKDLLLNRVSQFGKKKNRPVAYDVGTITYTSATQRKLVCTATFPGIGTITYGGKVVDRKDGTSVFPITGGTGGFKGAKGTVTLGPGATTAPNILEVTVPGNTINLHGAGGVA